MLETKIIISYIIICITYSLCRLHYLLTIKSDEEFNVLYEQLLELSEDKNITKTLVILQILFSPITAPFSMIKQLYRLLKRTISK